MKSIVRVQLHNKLCSKDDIPHKLHHQFHRCHSTHHYIYKFQNANKRCCPHSYPCTNPLKVRRKWYKKNGRNLIPRSHYLLYGYSVNHFNTWQSQLKVRGIFQVSMTSMHAPNCYQNKLLNLHDIAHSLVENNHRFTDYRLLLRKWDTLCRRLLYLAYNQNP